MQNWYTIAKGKAQKEGFKEKDANPKELRMGIEIELEHTDSRTKAKQIALDHLAEFPDYYTRLKKMETQAEAYWKNKSKKK